MSGLSGGVRFEEVWKLFGDDNAAVANLNLHIQEGEFLVLVGPSGCGKTTSLRMLAGLERPTFGRIWFGERDVTTLSPGERDVAMVFQSYALYPNMTVYKNLAFGPTVRGESKKDLRKRVAEVAEVLGIGGLLSRRPNELSGASVSGSPWGVPCSATHGCSCSTSRCRTLTRRCGSRCGRSSSVCTSVSP